MYIDSVTFWTTILSNIITSLIIGGVGYYIWKRQHKFTKKVDIIDNIYINSVLLSAKIKNLADPKHKNINYTRKTIIELLSDKLMPESVKSTFYFEDKAYDVISELTNMFYKIDEEGSNFSMTPEKLNRYLNTRLDKITELRNELKRSIFNTLIYKTKEKLISFYLRCYPPKSIYDVPKTYKFVVFYSFVLSILIGLIFISYYWLHCEP